MSIPTARPDSLGPTDKPCLDLTDGDSWKDFKEDLQALHKRIDTVLDAQARAMDLGNFANRMVGHTERLSDKHAELDLLGKQVVEMEKCARLINDQSSDEVNKAISASLSIADKVVKKTKKDIIKIGRLADNVKRDKKVAKTLKSLEVGMLDVTAPILNLPSQLAGLTAAPHAVLGPLLQALQTAHDAAPPALPAPTSLNQSHINARDYLPTYHSRQSAADAAQPTEGTRQSAEQSPHHTADSLQTAQESHHHTAATRHSPLGDSAQPFEDLNQPGEEPPQHTDDMDQHSSTPGPLEDQESHQLDDNTSLDVDGSRQASQHANDGLSVSSNQELEFDEEDDTPIMQPR
ncbi:hypothetical protein KCU95_g1397, partial [Aureobasidium melanogenum]